VVRDNNVSVVPAVLGCSPTTVVVQQSMVNDGVTFGRPQLLPVAHFVVFGFAVQPVILPTAAAWLGRRFQ